MEAKRLSKKDMLRHFSVSMLCFNVMLEQQNTDAMLGFLSTSKKSSDLSQGKEFAFTD